MQLTIEIRYLLQSLNHPSLIPLNFLLLVYVEPIKGYAKQAGIALDDGFIDDRPTVAIA